MITTPQTKQPKRRVASRLRALANALDRAAWLAENGKPDAAIILNRSIARALRARADKHTEQSL